MKTNTRNVFILVGILVGFLIFHILVSLGKSNVICHKVSVAVVDSTQLNFVQADQLKAKFLKQYPHILGGKLNVIDFDSIETYFKNCGEIANCEVYPTIKGVLRVEVTQRCPLLRVFEGGDSYYLDDEGRKIALSSNYAAHVLVLNGYINKLKSINPLLEFAKHVEQNEFLNAQFEQIYIESDGQVSIIPRVGNQVIELGSFDNYNEKLRNLQAFYKKGVSPKELNNYKKISLKYKNQVVCTRVD